MTSRNSFYSVKTSDLSLNMIKIHDFKVNTQRISIDRKWIDSYKNEFGAFPSTVKININEKVMTIEMNHVDQSSKNNIKRLTTSGAQHITYGFCTDPQILKFLDELPMSSKKNRKTIGIIGWDGGKIITITEPDRQKYHRLISQSYLEEEVDLEITIQQIHVKGQRLLKSLRYMYKKNSLNYLKNNKDHTNRTIRELKSLSPLYGNLKEIL